MKDWRVRNQLLVGFGTVILIFISLAIYNLLKLHQMAEITSNLYDHPMTISIAVRDIQVEAAKMRIGMKDLAIHAANNDGNINAIVNDLNDRENQVKENFEILKDRYLGDKQDIEDVKTVFDNWRPIRQSIIDMIRKGNMVEAMKAINEGKGDQYYSLVEEELSHLSTFASTKAKAFIDNSKIVEKRTKQLIYIFMILTFMIAFGIAYYVTELVTNRLNITINNLSTSSNEITSTLEQHQKTVASQSSAVNQTSTTMDELDKTSKISANQAKSAVNQSEEIMALVRSGSTQLTEAKNAAVHLKDKVKTIADRILDLSEQTNQIQTITRLVSNIANQTNLLALNAAVESARAGEHGKGFNVVATEIRKLADESHKSTERIQILVHAIQKATDSTVMVTEEGTKQVDEVNDLVQKSNEDLSNISLAINDAVLNIQQISLNMQQQASAIMEVTEAMNIINNGTKETLAGITQSKIGVSKIFEASSNLKSMI